MPFMDADEFEARYRADPDPWRYEDSDYERAKYAETLRACGEGPFLNALELGGSIGVFTALLAPRCQMLTTVDVAKTAAAMARRRLAGTTGVKVICGAIPDAVPEGEYDLIVASEILYYLGSHDLDRTLAMIRSRLVSGGRLVAVHWRTPGPERPFTAVEVHARLRDDPWLAAQVTREAPEYLLDVLERR